MPPSDLLLTLGLVWLALILLLPKRAWTSLPSRVRLVASGRRRHVLSPPSESASTATGPVRGIGSTTRELMRAFELGAPLYLVALVVEAFGLQRRREGVRAWSESSAGLLNRLWTGALSEEDVARRLQLSGAPGLPTDAPAPSIASVLVRPGVDMAQEWAEMLASEGESGSTLNGEHGKAEPVGASLQVQTLGRFRVTVRGAEINESLTRHPVLAFIWIYLMVRALLSPDARITRPDMSDELTPPGVDRAYRMKRLRDRLSDIRTALHSALSACVLVEGDSLGFDLTACALDVRHLLGLAEEIEGYDGLLDERLARDVRAALDSSVGEFLPDWDALEERVSQGRGVAGDAVRGVRARVEASRVILLEALADHHTQLGTPARAVPLLEEVLDRDPGREGSAMKLFDAYRATGQPARAEQLKLTHRLSTS